MDKVEIIKHGFNSKFLRVPTHPQYAESAWRTVDERMHEEGWSQEIISRTDRRYFIFGIELARTLIKIQAAYEMGIEMILELDCKEWDNLAEVVNENVEQKLISPSSDVLKSWYDNQPEKVFLD